MSSLSNPPIGGEAHQPATAAPAATAYCPRCGTAALGAQFCSSCGADLGLAATAAGPTIAAAARAVPWDGILITIGAALAIVGSFLPWLSVTAPFMGNITKSGLDGGGDGAITLITGIALALLGIALVLRSGSPRLAALGALVTSVLLGGIALLDIADVNSRGILLKVQLELDNSLLKDAFTFSVGMGLIVILIGAGLGIAGSVIALRAVRAARARPTT